MLLAYASHRPRSFSNPTPSLGCAGHMQFLKSNPTPRIFSNPGPTFPTPRQLKPGGWLVGVGGGRGALLMGLGFLGGKGGERERERGRNESEGDVPFERKL